VRDPFGERPRRHSREHNTLTLAPTSSHNTLTLTPTIYWKLSDLVSSGCCPNFVQMFEAFQFGFMPPASLWGSEKRKVPPGVRDVLAPPLPEEDEGDNEEENERDDEEEDEDMDEDEDDEDEEDKSEEEEEVVPSVRRTRGAARSEREGDSKAAVTATKEAAAKAEVKAQVAAAKTKKAQAAAKVKAAAIAKAKTKVKAAAAMKAKAKAKVAAKAAKATAVTAPKPKKSGVFQYIRMELCAHGDLEDFTKAQTGGLVALAEVPAVVFQMVFSLWVGRQEFHLRHYDVKLLNFFVTTLAAQGRPQPGQQPAAAALRYGLGNRVFRLPTALVIKLADYGTADVDPLTLDRPLSAAQFTTLENTDIDWLLHGSAAQQAFSADTFALGLAVAHLFTGGGPYEELLEEVTCPAALRAELLRLWQGGARAQQQQCQCQYQPVAAIIDGIDGADATLADTLYRFLVLFWGEGPRSAFRLGPRGSPVSALLHQMCLPLPGPVPDDVADGHPDAAVCEQTRSGFAAHREGFSLRRGAHPRLRGARERLAQVPGAEELLDGLLAFDPGSRPTMLEALQSPAFKCLEEETARQAGSHDGEGERSFMAYSSRELASV
jgi:hypothetical protein